MGQPVFYDTTLRDGSQALRRPWNHEEKSLIFNRLVAMGIKAIEIGYPASGEMDFKSCQLLAQNAPKDVVVSVLSRATEADVLKAVEAVKNAHLPRLNIFLMMNPLGVQHVLRKSMQEVTQMAVSSVALAKKLLPQNGEIEFSVEQFGDCQENLSEVLDALEKIVDAGATIINLPNTVERTRPSEFVRLVKAVKDRLGDRAQLSVHCHNDLGMATATTVESFFAGATQLEVTVNGLGERCGNTNLFEVAVALYNAGISIPLKMNQFYDTACFVSDMAHIPIGEKAPLMGSDCFVHRSGVHQDGANKTRDFFKQQYIAYPPELIGRTDGEKFVFTNQSGKLALQLLCKQNGVTLTPTQLVELMPMAKHLAEDQGELSALDLKPLLAKVAKFN